MNPPMKARAEQLVRVALTTTRGRIVLDLDRSRFNGIGFYRAMKSGPGGLIQSGITDDARKLFPRSSMSRPGGRAR